MIQIEDKDRKNITVTNLPEAVQQADYCKAVTEQLSTPNLKSLPNRGRSNIYISCVDTVSARFDIASFLKDYAGLINWECSKSLYWLDIGNARNIGQALLPTIGEIKQPNSKLYRTVSNLPMVIDEFKELLEAQADKNEPSCSLAEPLEKQNLFINSTLANMEASLLLKLFREGMTAHRGFFLNLANFRLEPIMVG
ncbi:hypothetical protein [Flavobacterium algoritolerans]|uniref:Uncharacterized protein n=1 Tax=Flavobacterium algoritolerans TaxID=3041254 RepID=A0ABT6VCL8_9FLAO|nr:hypothetical protein [Flavobacterium algoritolerans]MDI5895980.1 hypothetical protein [Flavobacterium algoritolerans]